MIKFEYDGDSLAKIEKKLGNLKSEAPKVLKNAINKTAKQARKDLASKAQEKYVVKSGRFNKAMKIKNASTGTLEAVIKATGSPMELKDFKVSPASVRTGNDRPEVIKAKVLSSSSLKSLDRGDGVKAFVAKFKSGHVTVAERQGKKRLPIKTLYSVSIPQMIGNGKKVYLVVKPDIMKNLQNNIDAEISKVLGG